MPKTRLRTLVIVLGDQLNTDASAFDGFDKSQDLVWMAEVSEESSHVWSSKQRIAVFLSAMRHFAELLLAGGFPLQYERLDERPTPSSLSAALGAALRRLKPQHVVMTAPGDWRVWQSLKAAVASAGLTLETRDDRHFYTTVRDFVNHAQQRKTLRLEYFYRELRRRENVLMQEGKPVGGTWNLDALNRKAFGKSGPGLIPPPARFEPDELTRAVIELVKLRFAEHPGDLTSFAWPVTRDQALEALQDFIQQRLPLFGQYQDAMWPKEPWLFHSLLSSALNLKLLDPREVVKAAEVAYREGHVPLASAEGFIRQILGWREYVRGIYWSQMPAYLERNALDAQEDLPGWYWDGKTEMACLHDVITQTLEYGYAHHIQRLMVTGLYALLLGVKPKQVHEWYLAVYVDAVEWVELPNTLGMSQYGDGGHMASKPYIASGKYIERMGGPCTSCRYDPGKRLGADACPFTTLYWDFLIRHGALLADNPRMQLQVNNAAKLSSEERDAILAQAAAHRRSSGSAGAARERPGTSTELGPSPDRLGRSGRSGR